MDIAKKALVAVIMLSAPSVGFAASSYISNVVISQLKSYPDGRFGRCVVQIDGDVNSDGNNTLTCERSNQVSFDCTGVQQSKAAAAEALTMAQLAYVSDKYVAITVDDDPDKRLFNTAGTTSVCLATSIIILGPIP